jgi:hypothetical protein
MKDESNEKAKHVLDSNYKRRIKPTIHLVAATGIMLAIR